MVKQLFLFLFLICSLHSFSQKLIYNSNGNILNSENQKITPDQVRELLVNNEQLLADYNAGRSKKTAGNILLWGGLGFITSDIIRRIYTHDKYSVTRYDDSFFPRYQTKLVKKAKFPSALGYVGLTLVTIALPIKIGFSKKIRNVVTEYNTQKATGNLDLNKQKLDFITNSNGIGFRLTLN
jgi:hypothetical protein